MWDETVLLLLRGRLPTSTPACTLRTDVMGVTAGRRWRVGAPHQRPRWTASGGRALLSAQGPVARVWMVTCVLVEEVGRGHTPDNLVGQRVTSEHRVWTTSEVRGSGWLVRRALVFQQHIFRGGGVVCCIGLSLKRRELGGFSTQLMTSYLTKVAGSSLLGRWLWVCTLASICLMGLIRTWLCQAYHSFSSACSPS